MENIFTENLRRQRNKAGSACRRLAGILSGFSQEANTDYWLQLLVYFYLNQKADRMGTSLSHLNSSTSSYFFQSGQQFRTIT